MQSRNLIEFCKGDRTAWKLTLQDINTTTKNRKQSFSVCCAVLMSPKNDETAVYSYNPEFFRCRVDFLQSYRNKCVWFRNKNFSNKQHVLNKNLPCFNMHLFLGKIPVSDWTALLEGYPPPPSHCNVLYKGESENFMTLWSMSLLVSTCHFQTWQQCQWIWN